MKFSIPLKRYLQSFIKFGQKVCFALEKRIRKTISTCQKKTTVINVLISNKLDLAKNTEARHDVSATRAVIGRCP